MNTDVSSQLNTRTHHGAKTELDTAQKALLQARTALILAKEKQLKQSDTYFFTTTDDPSVSSSSSSTGSKVLKEMLDKKTLDMSNVSEAKKALEQAQNALLSAQQAQMQQLEEMEQQVFDDDRGFAAYIFDVFVSRLMGNRLLLSNQS
jgi:hypothetical protein